MVSKEKIGRALAEFFVEALKDPRETLGPEEISERIIKASKGLSQSEVVILSMFIGANLEARNGTILSELIKAGAV